MILKIAWDKSYVLDLPEGHRFPMIKYELIHDQLLYEGLVAEENFFSPGLLSEEIILLTHTKEYWSKLKNGLLSPSEIRKTGFPFSAALIERERIITEGSRMAALYALENKVALNIAGGTHHAYSDRGEGFCLFNDIAVSANYLIHHQYLEKVLVIDLDVHQGNGTAKIFEDRKEVFTFSMHGANNYPLKKEQSDLDIGLPDKTSDEEYLRILKENLPQLFKKHQPQIVFYQSGVDVLSTDKLGKLSLSREGCKERDQLVLQQCFSNSVPVVISMGGGYSSRISDIVESHCNTFRVVREIYF